MGLLDPSSWSLEGVAQVSYDFLDPYYGEGGIFEGVTESVSEGDIIGGGIEAVNVVFVEPVQEVVVEEVIEPVTEWGQETYEEAKDEFLQPVTDAGKYLGLIIGAGALVFLLKK